MKAEQVKAFVTKLITRTTNNEIEWHSLSELKKTTHYSKPLSGKFTKRFISMNTDIFYWGHPAIFCTKLGWLL